MAEHSLDRQRVMFFVLVAVVSGAATAGVDQDQLAHLSGSTEDELSSAIDTLAEQLQKDVPATRRMALSGIGNLRDLLVEKYQRVFPSSPRKLCGVNSMPNEFPAMAEWEMLVSSLVPDVWALDWAQVQWEAAKIRQWVARECIDGEASIKSLISVVGVELEQLCSSVASTMSDVISRLQALLGVQADLASEPSWLVVEDDPRGGGQLRTAMRVLDRGETPSFVASGSKWFVARVRRFHGVWLMDAWNDSGEVRAWGVSELHDTVLDVQADVAHPGRPVFADDLEQSPMWLDSATAEGQVDHPGRKHLGCQRDEVYLLDYADILWPVLYGKFVGADIIYNDGPYDPGIYRQPDDLPAEWMTRRIYPRFNRRSPDDPAWVEFVSILLPYAGRIRLRVPGHPEIELDRMLAFCTGSIEEITRNQEDK